MPASSTRITVAEAGPRPRLAADVVFVPVVADATRRMPAALKNTDRKADGMLAAFLKKAALNDKPGSADAAYLGLPSLPRTAVVSVGQKAKADLEGVRVAGAVMAKHLATLKAKRALVATANIEHLADGSLVRALTEGLLLGDFRYDEHLSTKNKLPACKVQLLTEKKTVSRSAADEVRLAEIGASAANLARTLAHQPPNQTNPLSLARQARRLAAGCGLQCTVLDEKRMRKLGMGALLAVGQASATPPRLIVLKTRGAGSRRPVVLVGKAITFDTGGYSLKPSANMLGMKYDKCGGINVLATMTAIARLKPRVPVVGILAAAENAVSGAGYRPNDIIKTMSGKTVEVTNTDAEGRLVLCDALTYAQKTFAPREIIDMATLTGGAVIALGNRAAALFCNDPKMTARLIESGRNTHERLWELPMWEDYDAIMKGTDSDLINSGKERAAHCIQGAVFLKQFVESGTRWAHIDIAATGITDNDQPYCPTGATGFGVRLLVDYLHA